MHTTDWSIVLHGGCADTTPDLDHQNDVRRQLRNIMGVASISAREGKRAKDIVVEIVAALEDCPLFNAGRGAVLTEDGAHELEAGIVDGQSGLYGAVACISETKNPIVAANALLEEGAYCIIAPEYWEQNKRGADLDKDGDFGTVGAVVLDGYGNLAAGGSTGGASGKSRGRIGDTAILGAGLYADSKVAVVCSGAGDQILRHLVATKLANYHTSGFELGRAAHRAMMDFSQSNKTCAILAMDSAGKISISSTARVFYTASGSSDSPIQANLQLATHPILRYHIFHHGLQTTAGLSRFPTMKGHTHVVLRSAKDDLFSLDLDEYMRAMIEVYEVAGVLRDYYDVARCALVADGGDVLSIIPLHGLKKDWERINSPKKEFHESFPGYVSSMDGPQMDASRLRDICVKIQKASGISATYNYRFDGEQSDQNLFARIVRGELPQSRVWEDEHHVAFLTPFANIPGFTVLVARAHLPSDIFNLEFGDYSSLVRSAYSVAQTLKSSLGLRRCGIIFEGFEIDYAHIKLIPIHEKEEVQELSKVGSPITHIKKVQRVEAPRSWKTPSNHCARVLQEPWYSKVLAMEDTVFHATVRLFKNGLGYKYGLLPATMDAISSPMGLGSDSQPVSISLLGQSTHLADSMQFALEYFLRIEEGLPGVYYVGCSFRSEDPDKMHLNHFYHVECELLGDFAKGISVAEQYLFVLVSTLVEEQSDSIQAATGGIAHLKAFLDDYRSNDGRLPQITLDQALKLPGMGDNTWEYAVLSQPEKGRRVTRAGERQLIKHFGGAVWLTEMDHLSEPFYQAFTDETLTKGRCADLLLGNGEVLGLGERHLRPADVSEALRQHMVPAEPYTWYMQMKQTREIRTTGCGMGVERFMAWVFQHDDIRDLAIIPRMKGYKFTP